MLVQDRALPATRPKAPPPFSSSLRAGLRFSKNLDFSSWASEHSGKLLAFAAISAGVLLLFLLRSSPSSAASLFCLSSSSSPSSDPEKIPYPSVSFSSIPLAPPLSSSSAPFASFRADRWILISVSSSPSDSARALARIKGWQLLAVGDSRTPSDWSIKGAIFLSLELQAQLTFRSLDLLPYHSVARKNVGYLFAIQRGAKVIFDADDRAVVAGNDLAKHFDVDLASPESVSGVVLQYSHHDPNRTVVNPYVHFGQRSVWPRGLPLDRVGEVAHEAFYTETHSGRQFVQQGLSDGLPDVDAVFYYTRKSPGLEAFDIRFDPDAPKVMLPQGVMAPVNSLNTLFHSQAFWGMMLPVSVSSMASDVIRGYWLQRILWEIGGYVGFYPPTIYRRDGSETYPFAEEKDLHVNVGRLIEFLVKWRSSRKTLFERILDLSYAMAEEGFWSEQDVKLTAAWLQDLVSVGYPQPRLMSLEIDRPRAAIGEGDQREFVPKKLPSVHLGVEEAGTVNYEIGNLIRWRKHFGNVVLIMHLSPPVERTALEWRLLYGRIFRTVAIISEQPSPDLAVEHCNLAHAYKCLPKVFEKVSGAEGFLFLQDDMIFNYWNLLQADKTKLWITDKVAASWISVPLGSSNKEDWFTKQGELVSRAVGTFPVHLQTSYKENGGEGGRVVFCSSEIFYVPSRLVGDFSDLVGLVADLDIHHKIAVPMFFLAMDSPENFDSDALARTVYSGNQSTVAYTAQAPAVFPMRVRDEVQFIKLVRLMASGDPLLMELV